MLLRKYITILILMLFTIAVSAQENKKDIDKISREQVLEMTIEELSLYDLEELTKLMDIVGASSLDELYELLLNKDVTSASKSEESLFDSPLSTTVLTNSEITSSGATSIEEALRLVPGIIVREKTNGNYDVQIRGGQNMPMNNMLIYAENTTTLVMIDGRPVFNYGMGGILWETLPVSLGELDRIEVVRGPSSALYGPNAVNGVINLITKDINDDSPLLSANFQGGTLSTYIGDFSIANKISDKLSLGLSGSFENRERDMEDIYALYADEFLSIEEYSKLNISNKWSNDDISEMIDEPSIAKEKLGVNAYIDYKAKENLTFSVNGGFLKSQALTSTIGDNPTPYNIRSSDGYFINFVSNIYGFNLQSTLSNVEQDFCRGRTGWQQSTEQYNVNLDYLLKWNKLSIRPGLSYQSVYYDDRDDIEVLGEGFFNDRIALRNFAASARFDYSPSEKLRLVAALRTEKYNVPDKWMPSYQFIGSYKINEKNLLRAVYSRANQSTFMINAYSNYIWDREGLPGPDNVYFGSNNNPNMMVMDMIELGLRTRPSKNILLDIEAFYNKAKDFSALMPDKLESVTFADPTSGLNPALGQFSSTTLHTSHRPLDCESKQYGISFSADVIFSEKLIMKAHATYQKTTVDNFMDLNRDQIAGLQGAQYVPGMTADITNYLTYVGSGGLAGSPTPPQALYSSNLQPDPNDADNNVDNDATPSFWGSLSLTYKPTAKLSITAQGYYYDTYNLYSQYDNDSRRLYISGESIVNPYADIPGAITPTVKNKLDYTGNVDGKLILNAKVNYKLSDKVDVFVNGRNILNDDKQEYVFMDKIGGLYLAGFNIHF